MASVAARPVRDRPICRNKGTTELLFLKDRFAGKPALESGG